MGKVGIFAGQPDAEGQFARAESDQLHSRVENRPPDLPGWISQRRAADDRAFLGADAVHLRRTSAVSHPVRAPQEIVDLARRVGPVNLADRVVIGRAMIAQVPVAWPV